MDNFPDISLTARQGYWLENHRALLAHVTVSKYQDALPLYRQEAILKRIDVDFSHTTLANGMPQARTLIQRV